MGRNNSSSSLNSPTVGEIFHSRSGSNLSTRSDDTVTSSLITRKAIRSVAELAPLTVSCSSEDVSYRKEAREQRHSFCHVPSKLAVKDFRSVEQKSLKFAVVGDSGVGKTSLLTCFTSEKIPETHAPTIYDKFNVTHNVYGKRLSITWCDTAGQDDFAHLRSLCYPQLNAAVICFSVVNRTSFENVKDKWMQELKHHCPNVPTILVGTQIDKRADEKVLKDLKKAESRPVTKSDGIKMALQIKAITYLECSALTQQNTTELLKETVVAALGLNSDTLMSSNAQCATCKIL